MSDLLLTPSSVELALKRNALPPLRRLDVAETDSEVVLNGVVNSYYLKQLAQEAVMPLLSGRKLRNRIEVVRE